MKTPAAPARLTLAPLVLVLVAGSAGFAAGWISRMNPPVTAVSTGSTPALRPAASAPTGTAAPSPGTGSSGLAVAPRAPADPSPADAKARLVAWVEAGCPNGRFEEIESLLETWSSAAPREALEFVHHAPRFRNRTRAYGIPLSAIAAIASTDAIDWIRRELPEMSQRTAVAESTIGQLLPDHPQPALDLAHADEIPVSSYQFSRILHILVKRDPEAALDGFARLPPHGRAATAEAMIEGWGEIDRGAATTWALAQSGTPHGSIALHALLRDIAAEAPEDLATVLMDPRVSDSARYDAVRAACYSRPDVGIELLATLPRDRATPMLDIVFDDLFAEDPAAAMEIGHSLLAPEALASRVRREWSAWMRSDRPAALAWAATVTDPDVARQLQIEQRLGSVCRDPAAYLNALGDTPPADDEQELVTTALRWFAERDLDRAARWMAGNTTTTTPAHATMLAQQLCRRDPATALGWIESLPTGPARDAAHAVAAGHCAARNKTALADRSIAGISDPVLQTQAAFHAFRTLRENDEDVALQWLDTQPLPPEVRASWIAITPGGSREHGCIPDIPY